ncbi:MAG: hypothetical protein ACKO9F_20000 [Caldilinea sp.]
MHKNFQPCEPVRHKRRTAVSSTLVGKAAKPMMNTLDLHGERAAQRGNPSFVWRAGQDRRLALILA